SVSLSGYRDVISNASLLMSNAPFGFAGDLLPDIGSNAAVFNTGNFTHYGYSGSLTQDVGDKVEVTASFGRAGALQSNGAAVNSADNLRQGLRMDQKYWASARASATLPGAGTQIVAAYQWMEE